MNRINDRPHGGGLGLSAAGRNDGTARPCVDRSTGNRGQRPRCEWRGIVLVLLAAVLVGACAHGRTPNPSTAPEAGSGQVVIARNNNLFGWWLSVAATFDEAPIAHLRSGEHVAFRAAPGIHTVGVAGRGISFAVEADHKYFFLISTDDSQAGFDIERLDPARGEEWAAKTKPSS
jgi:hypothetical protein